MARVYLETSFFSACVSTRQDAASVYRRMRSREWWMAQRQQHALHISAEVLAELAAPAYPRRDAALELAGGLALLPLNDDAAGLARILVREKVVPGPAGAGDAVHLAVAAVHGMDFMLSWNVRHLANLNKVEHVRTVCRRAGFVRPEIVTPDNLWGE